MPSRTLNRIARIAAALLLLSASLAQAQLFRAYLASDGNDSNPCTLGAPCRLLPAALAAVASGGEIWMLDSANYNTGQVTIAKSVSILAIPGVVGSIIATGGGDGLHVDGGGIVVSLRNLVFVHFTGSASNAGVAFVQGAELHVADCEFVMLQGYGLMANSANGLVTVKDSRFRGTNTGYALYAGGSVRMAASRVNIVRHSWGVYAESNARLTLSDSNISGAIGGGVLLFSSTFGNVTRVVVERTTISDAGIGIYAQTGGAGTTIEVAARQNAITHSNIGIQLLQVSSSMVTVMAEENLITGSQNAILFNGGTVYTRGNNTLRFNVNDVVGGTLTGFPGS